MLFTFSWWFWKKNIEAYSTFYILISKQDQLFILLHLYFLYLSFLLDQNVNNCPVDRKKFNSISIMLTKDGPVIEEVWFIRPQALGKNALCISFRLTNTIYFINPLLISLSYIHRFIVVNMFFWLWILRTIFKFCHTNSNQYINW